MSTSDPLLEVAGLSIRIAAGQGNLVDDVAFAVGRGETLCIVGESGCGKSLTGLSLMGLLPMPPAHVTGGSVRFDGRELLGLSQAALADLRGDRMAMIFQEPMTALNPAFTIGNQIAEGVERHRGGGRRAARARALEMLEKVGIPAARSRLDAYPHQLSGGMRQRAMIAMALANDPQLVIADEPTTALDVTIQAQVLDLIRTLQRDTGTALILITHDLGVVAEVADRVAVMYAGRIVEDGPVGAIFDDPQHPYTVGLMGSLPGLEGGRGARLATIPGMVPAPETMPQGCRFADRCPFAIPRCAEAPALRALAPGHRVACHRAPLEDNVAAEEAA